MKAGRMMLALSLGVIAAGCGKQSEEARVADSVRVADSLRADSTAKAAALATSTDTTAAGRAANPRPPREVILAVTEESPGLLARAKVLPIDAQHIAQTKYPQGDVKTAAIGTRGNDLVYTYGIAVAGEGVQNVLVNAMDGSIVASMTAPKKP